MAKDGTINTARIKGTIAKDPYRGQGQKSPFCFLTVVTGSGKFSAYHNVTGFGSVVDQMKNLKKGHEVEVEGRISYRRQERNGVKYSEASIIADRVHHFLPDLPQDEGDMDEDLNLPF